MVASLAALALTAGCSVEEPAEDELFDFVEPETTSLEGSTPYDTYVLLVEDRGEAVLSFPDAELRAQELCVEASDAAVDRSVTDAALLRAYCPEVAAGG